MDDNAKTKEELIRELAELRVQNAALLKSVEELKDSEQRFRGIVETTKEWLWTLDINGVHTYSNKVISDILGYSQEDFNNKSVFDFIYSDDLPAAQKIFSTALANRQGWTGEVLRWRHRDGTYRYLESNASPIIGPDGNLRGWHGADRDITERKRAEEALRESEERYRTLAEATFEGVALSDLGILIDANSQLAKMLGCELREIIGRSVIEFIVPEDRELVQRNIEIRKELTYENRLLRKDGSTLTVETKAEHYDYQGRNIRVTVLHDVTERKQAEKELEKHRAHLEELVEQRTKEISLLNDQLRQSQKLEAVGILAGGIAHEFNNILTTMNGSMYLIQKKLPEDSPAMKYAEQILASLKKASELSQGLLTFSRKQKISLKPMYFNEIIGNVGKMLIQLIGEDIELAFIPTDKNPTVMADLNQIEQVLVNLATNARDAMPDGGRLTISTDVMKMDEHFKKKHGYGISGEYVVLTVSDSGTGMEEMIQEKIFEPFFTTKAVGRGSGLGLAVTYGIVKQHDGFIDVESVPGEGTTFKIYFPTVKTEVFRHLDRASRPAIVGTETILLAEDDEDARVTMSEMVRMNGYTVLEARDGEEAIRVFMENKDGIQLVLLDVRMPKKNGREVYEEIRNVHQGTKFIFISGYTADIMETLGVDEGGINFISKAALPDELLRKLREVLDQ